MAGSSKLLSKPVVARRSAPKPSKAEKPAAGGKSEPFVRVYFSQALSTKALVVLARLEESPDPVKHREALADLIVELTYAGMDYSFMKQLKLAKPGFIIQQSANLGMVGAQQLLGTVIRNIICRMDKAQLLSVCGSIRHLMR